MDEGAPVVLTGLMVLILVEGAPATAVGGSSFCFDVEEGSSSSQGQMFSVVEAAVLLFLKI